MTQLRYHLWLIAKSLRRDRWFTAVMVLTQALSVSLFVTALSSARRYSGMRGQVSGDVYRLEGTFDPTLSQLFKGSQFEGFGEFAANFVSIPTIRALERTGLADRATPSFVAAIPGGPADRPPASLPVRFCTADLFDIFHADFAYGGPWTRADEGATPPVPAVVMSDLLNQALYGGANSVGRIIRIAGRDFRVVGVMRQRPGKLNVWDLGFAPENLSNVLVPFAFADALRPVPVISWPPLVPDDAWPSISASATGISEYWLRLSTPAARDAYARALKAIAPNLSLRSADAIAKRYARPPAAYRVFVIFTLVLLEASVINVMRMLLAKATARAAEIGIHRALGAARNAIFFRQLLEGTAISLAGSALGILLALPTVAMFDRLIPDSPVHLAITPSIVLTAFVTCLVAGLVSGVIPAWRVAAVAPTRNLGRT